jgi:hypothetical protein
MVPIIWRFMGETAIFCPFAIAVDELVARASVLVVRAPDCDQVASIFVTMLKATAFLVLTAATVTEAVTNSRLARTSLACLFLTSVVFGVIALWLDWRHFMSPFALILKATFAFLKVAAIRHACIILLLDLSSLLFLRPLLFRSSRGTFSGGTIGVLCVTSRGFTTATTAFLAIGGLNAIRFIFDSFLLSHHCF